MSKQKIPAQYLAYEYQMKEKNPNPFENSVSIWHTNSSKNA